MPLHPPSSGIRVVLVDIEAAIRNVSFRATNDCPIRVHAECASWNTANSHTHRSDIDTPAGNGVPTFAPPWDICPRQGYWLGLGLLRYGLVLKVGRSKN